MLQMRIFKDLFQHMKPKIWHMKLALMLHKNSFSSLQTGTRGSVVCIGTTLRGGLSEVRILVDDTDIPPLRNVQTGSGARTTFCSMATGVLTWK